jgi:hypothetical protein
MGDLSVVVGPVNFLEPLSVGTPTVVLERNLIDMRPIYRQETYDQMVEQGKEFGNFSHTKSLDEISTSIPEAMNAKPLKPERDEELGNILDAILRHLKHPETVNKKPN